jgi:uncharacterized protein
VKNRRGAEPAPSRQARSIRSSKQPERKKRSNKCFRCACHGYERAGSAALKPEGLQRTTLLLAITKPARFYVSRPILEEYAQRALTGRISHPQGNSTAIVAAHQKSQPCREPVARLEVANDQDDNIFLECADAARADYLITGNPNHFSKFWKNTKIITSREFISLAALHLLE